MNAGPANYVRGVLSSDQKGGIAETAIVHAATKLGLAVFRPVVEGGRYDLIFEAGQRLLRVQCKWAAGRGDVVVVRLHSCRRTCEGMRSRPYTADEIDGVAAYSPDVERCYFLPAAMVAGRRSVHLRLAPSRNNQRLAINWAHVFDFATIDWTDPSYLGL